MEQPKQINNTSERLVDDLKSRLSTQSRISIAAASFSIYAFEAMKAELEKVEEVRFIFTSPTFVADKTKKEKREFYIPKLNRERNLYGTEFEIKLRNQLSQKAIAKECAAWIRKKVKFKSNSSQEGMGGFLHLCDGEPSALPVFDMNAPSKQHIYLPFDDFSTTQLGCEKGNNVYTMVNVLPSPSAEAYLQIFNQQWENDEKFKDVTARVLEYIETVYQENAPEYIYFIALYNIFHEFLEDISEDVLPNERTGFKNSLIWNKLYNFQKDAALAIINKLEKYNGCILADSVGLGKTFTALAVIKYYENRNKSVLVLCPKKLNENWITFRSNYKNNPIAGDRLRYDILFHTDLSREHGSSNGLDLDHINWGNYDLVVIDETISLIDQEAEEIRGFRLRDMDYISWRRDLAADQEVLRMLLLMLEDITPAHDSKLQMLIADLKEKFAHPINKDNRKVLIFTAFADTADYLYQELAERIKADCGLNAALITGSTEGKCTIPKFECTFNNVLTFFSPISKDKGDIFDEKDCAKKPWIHENIDVLIATDCIAEGQNLQDCDYLINYDIHWNPVRIIQRFGRIDRIGSRNKEIQLVNYWPDMELDEYIQLKGRVESRMKATVLTSTGDDNLLSDNEKGDLEYRRKQLKHLQEEVVDIEDMDTGINIMDLGLNEFRLDLLSYIKEHPDIEHAPFGMNAVAGAKGDVKPGVIYVLKNRNNAVNIDKKNLLHPFYMVYLSDDGEVICDHLHPKKLLDTLRLLCKDKKEYDRNLCALLSKETCDGRHMEHYSDLLQKAIDSMVRIKEESDIDSLFTLGETTALTNEIKGLDDFELITFLVIR